MLKKIPPPEFGMWNEMSVHRDCALKCPFGAVSQEWLLFALPQSSSRSQLFTQLAQLLAHFCITQFLADFQFVLN